MPRRTVEMIPRIRPALAVPLFSGARLPASIASSSLFPIAQANGPRIWQKTSPMIPRTRTVVAWLASGYALDSDGNCGGCDMTRPSIAYRAKSRPGSTLAAS